MEELQYEVLTRLSSSRSLNSVEFSGLEFSEILLNFLKSFYISWNVLVVSLIAHWCIFWLVSTCKPTFSLLSRVHSNPESLGKIDFAHYKAALPGLKMVDEFEKAVSSKLRFLIYMHIRSSVYFDNNQSFYLDNGPQVSYQICVIPP